MVSPISLQARFGCVALHISVLLGLLPLAGCTFSGRVGLDRLTGGSAALLNQFQAFDCRTGRTLSFADIVRRCRSADVVLFGEQHGDAVCNQLEAQLLHALSGDDRHVSLAMEFFEADTQAALDAYLRDQLTESEFREQARQKGGYALAHRPLIEYCRLARVPVVAANAPRKLVSAYRRSGLAYGDYLASLAAEERCWLPASVTPVGDPYRARFMEIMSAHSAEAVMPAKTPPMPTTAPTPPVAAPTMPITMPTTQPGAPGDEQAEPPRMPAMQPEALFRSQLLWDESMATAVARQRELYPGHQMLLIVGSFHVEQQGGTLVKLRRQRPNDDIMTIIYRGSEDPEFTFGADDRNAGDIVIHGLIPPAE